jgi:hypothetical protein
MGSRGEQALEPADLALKLATKDAIRGAGGQEFLSESLGRAQSRFSDYGSPNKPDFMPIDLVRKVQALGAGKPGWPHITHALARADGFDLYKLPETGASKGDWLKHVGALSTEAAEITSKICASLADDQRIDAREIKNHALIADAEQLVTLGVQLLAQLREEVGG